MTESNITAENEFFTDILASYADARALPVADVLFEWEQLGVAHKILKLGDTYDLANKMALMDKIDKIVAEAAQNRQSAKIA